MRQEVMPEQAMPDASPEMMDQPGPPESGSNSDLLAGMQQLGEALNGLAAGAAEAGMPPEAVDHLAQANQSYNAFMEIITGGGVEQPMAGPGMQQSDAMGNQAAIPVR